MITQKTAFQGTHWTHMKLGYVSQWGWDARASLLHELVEQREKQLGTTAAQRAYGSETSGAHGQGLAAELGMIGASLESDTGLLGASTNPDDERLPYRRL